MFENVEKTQKDENSWRIRRMAGVAVTMKHWNGSEINMAVKHINSKKIRHSTTWVCCQRRVNQPAAHTGQSGV